MSTTIYNGFVLNRKINAIIPFLKEAKKQLIPFVEAKTQAAMCGKIADLVLRLLDGEGFTNVQLNMKPAYCPPGSSGYLDSLVNNGDLLGWAKELVEAHAEAAERPDERSTLDYDPDCGIFLEFILFPLGKETYGIAFGSDELCEAFLELPQVKKFCWWNNTDAPDDVPAEEWTRREQIWGKLLKSFWYADDGLRYTMFQARRHIFRHPGKEQVEKWFRENRETLVARRTGTLLRAKLEELNPPPEKEKTVSYICDLQLMAKEECKKGTPMAVQAMTTAEAEIPKDWDGIMAIISEEKSY